MVNHRVGQKTVLLQSPAISSHRGYCTLGCDFGTNSSTACIKDGLEVLRINGYHPVSHLFINPSYDISLYLVLHQWIREKDQV